MEAGASCFVARVLGWLGRGGLGFGAALGAWLRSFGLAHAHLARPFVGGRAGALHLRRKMVWATGAVNPDRGI